MENQSNMFVDLADSSLYHSALDKAMSYLESALQRNVYPNEDALNDLAVFDEDLPIGPGNARAIIDDLHTYGGPATTSSVGGRYYGFVTGSSVPAALAAKTLSTFWDQNSAMDMLSPLSGKLELVVQRWLRGIFSLPKQAVAGYVSGTSMANFCGLAAARYRLFKNLGWDINRQGFQGAPSLQIITGTHAHSTVIKTLCMLGFGKENITFVDVDEQGRIKPELVPEMSESTLLILQAGNVNSGSFDDFKTLVPRAKRAGAWVHVDGAFGLWAAASKSLAYLTAGIEQADSMAVDAHKTINVPYDSGIILCADPESLTSALHMSAGYIVSSTRDGMRYTPEMSRRARIIELWATLKYLGTAGLDEMIGGFQQHAGHLAELINNIEGFEVLNDVVFNQVIVACSDDTQIPVVLDHIQSARKCWVGPSTWFERPIIRVSICAWTTTEEDIQITAASFAEAMSAVSD